MQIPDDIKELITTYPGRSAGTAAGCVIGILLLTLGPKRTLILFLFTVLGLIIGNLFDSHISISSFKFPFSTRKRGEKDYTDRDIDIE